MIGLRLFSDNGQALGEIVGDYFKLAGTFRFDNHTPLNNNGRAFIDYPAVVVKDGKRYKRERLFFISYEAVDNTVVNPITITQTDTGLLVYHAIALRGTQICPANIYYGYINEIQL